MRISEAAGMSASFDQVALSYDSTFTRTRTGKLQREQVWAYLDKIIPGLPGLEVLELNGGTGEDAVFLAKKGFNVLTTDVSSGMLQTIEAKITLHDLKEKIHTRIVDLNQFDPKSFTKKYDLILSNFGGLNCLSPIAMERLVTALPEILSPGGRFIGVIMPTCCLWETCYFAGKFRFGKAARRWTTRPVTVSLQGATVDTWYHAPGKIRKYADRHFTVMTSQPIGFTLPPSYLENFFQRHNNLLTMLNRWEKRLNRFSFLSGVSDHFLIDLKLK